MKEYSFKRETLLKKTENKNIWLMLNVSSNEHYIGKFQSTKKIDSKTNAKNVLHEASYLQQLQGHTGIPLMYWSGVEGV
jgi:serine/threonine protein kinase